MREGDEWELMVRAVTMTRGLALLAGRASRAWSAAPDRRELDFVLGQRDAQLGETGVGIEDPQHPGGIEKLDAIVGAEMPVLIVPPVRIGGRVAAGLTSRSPACSRCPIP